MKPTPHQPRPEGPDGPDREPDPGPFPVTPFGGVADEALRMLIERRRVLV